MANIVVIDAGIGGVPCAYDLRKHLDSSHQVTLIGSSGRFEFTPSNPWMAVGWREAADTSVELRDRVPMTYVTPEPYIGHMGLGGVGDSKGLMEAELRQRHIKWISNAKLPAWRMAISMSRNRVRRRSRPGTMCCRSPTA